MAKNFNKLRNEVRSDPRRAARVDAKKAAMRDAMRLAELRNGVGATQTELAERMRTTQENVSRIERNAKDAYLATLNRYVTALGGRLEVHAIFPDRDVALLVEEERGLRHQP